MSIFGRKRPRLSSEQAIAASRDPEAERSRRRQADQVLRRAFQGWQDYRPSGKANLG